MQTSALKFDESGEPLHIPQAVQIRAFRAAWKEASHKRTPRISVSRSIFPLLDDRTPEREAEIVALRTPDSTHEFHAGMAGLAGALRGWSMEKPPIGAYTRSLWTCHLRTPNELALLHYANEDLVPPTFRRDHCA